MLKTEFISKIKSWRVELDKHTFYLQQMKGSRQISIAITATQNARMWLGQVLNVLDEPNPYPDSKDATNNKIAPTTDVFTTKDDTPFVNMDGIKQAKVMRQRLTSLYEEMEHLEAKGILSRQLNDKGMLCISKSWAYIVEANMWLGMELGRIRDEEKN